MVVVLAVVLLIINALLVLFPYLTRMIGPWENDMLPPTPLELFMYIFLTRSFVVSSDILLATISGRHFLDVPSRSLSLHRHFF